MKYYCEYCKSEWDISKMTSRGILDRCINCGLGSPYIKPISKNETVAQWEARRGEKYPDTAPVWVMFKVKEAHVRVDTTKKVSQSYLVLYEWGETKGWRKNNPIVVATETGSPPNDWRPE